MCDWSRSLNQAAQFRETLIFFSVGHWQINGPQFQAAKAHKKQHFS